MPSELDFSSLENEFDLNSLDIKISNELTEMRNRLANVESLGDSDKIIRMNIERANFFLDLIEQEFTKGGGAFNSRMLEATGKLIAEVTNAANTLKAIEIQSQSIGLKERTLDLKEFEVKNKLDKGNQEHEKHTINNTMIVTDRESLLKMLKEENTIDVLQSK